MSGATAPTATLQTPLSRSHGDWPLNPTRTGVSPGRCWSDTCPWCGDFAGLRMRSPTWANKTEAPDGIFMDAGAPENHEILTPMRGRRTFAGNSATGTHQEALRKKRAPSPPPTGLSVS